MKKTLTFTITIDAPRSVVWENMLSLEGYEQWTAPFGEGSSFTGSWERGSRIAFQGPDGSGMSAVIAENVPLELVSIRHVGEITHGIEDTTSDQVRAWAPACEQFRFADADDGAGCALTVTLETLPAHERHMLDVYPKALDRLKQICEQ